MSTAAVYGNPIDPNMPITEEHPLKPVNMYGVTKLFGEKFVNSIRGISRVILRGANIYGPGQREGSSLIPTLIAKFKRGDPTHLTGEGKPSRDFIYVDDIVNGIICSLTAPEGIYNLSSGKGTSVKTVWELINDEFNQRGYRIQHYLGQVNNDEVERIVLPNEKAKKYLGWEPKMTLETGIKTTVDSFFND
jgi:UDP-glucose 4-epimerase